MMRLRAVRALLVGDVASLRVARVEGSGEAAWKEQAAREREALEKARRRALLIVGLDAVALAVLFLLRDRGAPFLALGRGEEGAFTLGVLLVAVHLGYRLAQLRQLRTVERLYGELMEREEG
jgi:hypothetical protein